LSALRGGGSLSNPLKEKDSLLRRFHVVRRKGEKIHHSGEDFVTFLGGEDMGKTPPQGAWLRKLRKKNWEKN